MRDFTCPHCGQDNAGVAAIPGAAIDCRACGNSFLAPAASDSEFEFVPPERAKPVLFIPREGTSAFGR